MSVSAPASRTIYVKGDPEKKVLGDCPFCHRALLTLELKGLKYDKDYIDFSNKPEWVFKYSEKGSVPIMRDSDTWIPDSGDICDYLERTYEPKIGASSSGSVAEKLFPSFVQFLMCKPEEAGEKESALREQLGQLDDLLGRQPFVAGERMGGGDTLIAPRVYHISVALPHFKKWDGLSDFSNVVAYLDRVKQVDAFQKTDYGPDMIIQGWKSHGL